ncbi:Unannotated [Lentimonas sp. CC19]|nr:Unannotated [Lentimonas sp. CC10]CAA6695654.1 Unannotated [Lentimonas sp. CC19]CAA7069968.1 Unannotated [Lentimonas sp. CC11]
MSAMVIPYLYSVMKNRFWRSVQASSALVRYCLYLSRQSLCLKFSCLVATLFFSVHLCHAVVQTVDIRAGWNAVYLEVEPYSTAPSDVFEGLSVECVAGYVGGGATRQYVTNPTVDLSRASGWLRWYPSSEEHSFLSDLGEIYGGRGYLIKASESFTLKIEGRPVVARTEWVPDSYNFVGFSVAERGGPTFYEFFEGSAAHRDQSIYRMQDGVWKKVISMTSEALAPGEAFWVFCNGSSDFQGPLQVAAPDTSGLVLMDSPLDLMLTNRSPNPVSYSVQHVIESGKPGVPLSLQMTILGDVNAPLRSVPVDFPSTSWSQDFPPIDGGFSIRMPVALRRGDLEIDAAQSYLLFESSLATRIWVPIKALSTSN